MPDTFQEGDLELPFGEACMIGDFLNVDDVLLGPSGGAAENPRVKSTWSIEWPYKLETRQDPSTGKVKTTKRYPSGMITQAKVRGITPRVKIYTDIGMLAIDRDIRTSCVWRTPFCARHCYNWALENVRPKIIKSGPLDEAFWGDLDGELLYDILHGCGLKNFAERVKKSPSFLRGRMRLATRGEALSTTDDVFKVADLCEANPSTVFWITTRAWRNDEMADLIEAHIMSQPNSRVLASLDPSHSPKQFERIMDREWNTIFFGDDTFIDGRFLCPKTWQKKKSYCRKCRNGCFKDGPVHVHLKTHGTKVTEEELREFRARGATSE